MPADFLTGYPRGAFIRKGKQEDAVVYIIPNPIVNAGPEAPNKIAMNAGGSHGIHPEAILRMLLDHSTTQPTTMDLVAYQDLLLSALKIVNKES